VSDPQTMQPLPSASLTVRAVPRWYSPAHRSECHRTAQPCRRERLERQQALRSAAHCHMLRGAFPHRR